MFFLCSAVETLRIAIQRENLASILAAHPKSCSLVEIFFILFKCSHSILANIITKSSYDKTKVLLIPYGS